MPEPPSPQKRVSSLYKEDYYRWAMETAGALRRRELEAVDFEAIAEELEDLGRAERKELRSRLKQLMVHILKWVCQPNKRSFSWRASVDVQREEIRQVLEENPSLRRELPEVMAAAYRLGVRIAVKETGLPQDRFPAECPFSFDELMYRDPETWRTLQ